VTPENLPAYFKNGASATRDRRKCFRKDWLAREEIRSIRAKIQAYLKALP